MIHRWLTAMIGPLLGLTLCVAAMGCAAVSGAPGELTLSSRGPEGQALAATFDTAIYRFHSRDEITAVLLDAPPDQARQAAIVRMFWRPRAGRTAINPGATNASVDYVIFAKDQVGLYHGAGYVFPANKPGAETLKLRLWELTLQLDAATERFDDRLGSATLKGKANATRDDAGTTRLIRELQRRVRQATGEPITLTK